MRQWVPLTGTAVVSMLFVAVLRLPGISDVADSAISDLGQLVAAALASLGCWLATRRTHGDRRTAWLLMSAGTGMWAAGEVVWSYYELVLDQPVPFPSLADVGFLGFPFVAAVGLVNWLGSQSHQLVARWRDLLDGAIIAASLLALSWVTSLGAIATQSGVGWVSLSLSLAYPVGDLVLATLVLLALSRSTDQEHGTLGVLAAGIGGLAVSDSAYVYLTSTGAYTSADVLSSGWVVGFLLVGAAGVSVRRADGATRSAAPDHGRGQAPSPGLVLMSLPYIPFVAAAAVIFVDLARSPTTPVIDLCLAVVMVTLVLTRQFLAMADNQRLLSALADARDELHHQTLHDALTGVANRVLFADRLDQALLHPAADLGIVYCDLDDFKAINDQHGHEAGDLVLTLVAERLAGCVRATDTVARLGGDEFAILLENADDAQLVADRILVSMREPMQVGGVEVTQSLSLGIAQHRSAVQHRPEHRRESGSGRLASVSVGVLFDAAERDTAATLLRRRADGAMYAAKGAGKGRAVMADMVGWA